jgi:hypothetical protein
MTVELVGQVTAQDGTVTFDHTIPQALVDRGDPTTVLVTSWVREGDRLTAGAVWPRLGGYYMLPDPTRHDPLLVLETGRQCALLAAHVVADIPLATMQIMHELRFEAVPEHLSMGSRPTEIVTRVECVRTEPGKSSIVQVVGRVSGRCVVPPERLYTRVRGRDPEKIVIPTGTVADPVAPELVGRILDRDVVLSPDPLGRSGVYALRIDTEHPNFFDNPTDHTPGMLLMESMRQAVVAESGDPARLPVSAEARFTTFVELDAPADVVVERAGDRYRTEVRQFGRNTTHAWWTVDG